MRLDPKAQPSPQWGFKLGWEPNECGTAVQ